MTHAEPFQAEDLVRHAAALRRLARRLVRDETRADDVVQEAYVTALEHPPRSRASLGAWLRRVVASRANDLARGSTRRRERERAAARPERALETRSAGELALQAEVLAAVRALREPYRTAVVLRYYHDLPPRRIAKRLGVPVKTVKTRLARALAELRERLDGRHGERSTWVTALLPLAGARTGAGTLAVTLGGVTLMNTKLVSIALGAAALIGLWVLWPSPPPAEPLPASPALAPAAPALAPPEEIALETEEAPPTTRTLEPVPVPTRAAEPADATPLGELAVRAVWAADGEPAPGVAIVVRALDEPVLNLREQQVVTNAFGVAHASVRAGRVELGSDRGGRVETTVEPGGDHEVRFEIPVGVDVEGIVVGPAGRRIRNAGIWLTTGGGDWLGGRIVTHADQDGSFFVRSADPSQSLGALADGFTPSELVDLDTVAKGERGGRPVTVQLILARRGAGIEGSVVGDDGEPVAGALVALGPRTGTTWRADGTRQEFWTPLVVRTGRDGAFRCESLAPGDVPVSVRAEGFAPWYGVHECLAGRTTRVDVVLERGVTVSGTVTAEDGSPASGARVMALDRAPEDSPWLVGPLRQASAFGRPTALTDADGSYVLPLVPAGEIHLFAAGGDDAFTKEDYGGRDETKLRAEPGDTVEWNARLSRGLVIRGRVESAGGGPPDVLTQLFATPEEAGARALATIYAEDGSFLFAHCEDVPYTLAITTPGAEVSVTGVRPGGDEVVLTLPNSDPDRLAEVTGRFEDTGGRCKEGDVLSVYLSSGAGWFLTAELDGADFRFEEVEPGRYRPAVYANDECIWSGDWIEVEPGAEVDLGEIQSEPGGGLTVSLVARQGARIGAPFASLGEGMASRRLERDGDVFRGEGLSPGTQVLRVSGEGIYVPLTDVEVVAGETREVEVEAVPAVPVPYEIAAPPRGTGWSSVELRVRDGAGRIVWRIATLTVDTFPFESDVSLAPGAYTFEAETDTGIARSRAFTVVDLQTAPEPVRIDLR